MQAYTYGSQEGIQALKDGLLSNPGEGHFFRLAYSERQLMANALETASFAGKPWFEARFGLAVEQSALWSEYLVEMELNDDEMIGLVDALAVAYDLGDDFAGGWLSGLCECVDIEWI